MPFKAILKELVETVTGGSGAILADWEGESVEHFCLYDDFQLKILGAHKGIILNLIKDVHDRLSAGAPREAVVTTAFQHVIIGMVGPEYSLVMSLARDAVVGQALYRFRKAVRLLEKEIY